MIKPSKLPCIPHSITPGILDAILLLIGWAPIIALFWFNPNWPYRCEALAYLGVIAAFGYCLVQCYRTLGWRRIILLIVTLLQIIPAWVSFAFLLSTRDIDRIAALAIAHLTPNNYQIRTLDRSFGFDPGGEFEIRFDALPVKAKLPEPSNTEIQWLNFSKSDDDWYQNNAEQWQPGAVAWRSDYDGPLCGHCAITLYIASDQREWRMYVDKF